MSENEARAMKNMTVICCPFIMNPKSAINPVTNSPAKNIKTNYVTDQYIIIYNEQSSFGQLLRNNITLTLLFIQVWAHQRSGRWWCRRAASRRPASAAYRTLGTWLCSWTASGFFCPVPILSGTKSTWATGSTSSADWWTRTEYRPARVLLWSPSLELIVYIERL